MQKKTRVTRNSYTRDELSLFYFRIFESLAIDVYFFLPWSCLFHVRMGLPPPPL